MPRRSRPGQGTLRSGDSGGSGGDTAKLFVVWGSDHPRDQCHQPSRTPRPLQGFAPSLMISPLLLPAPRTRRQRPIVALWRERSLRSDGSHRREQGQREHEFAGTRIPSRTEPEPAMQQAGEPGSHHGEKNEDSEKEMETITSGNKIMALRKRLEGRIRVTCAPRRIPPGPTPLRENSWPRQLRVTPLMVADNLGMAK
jgi:hypothetical protein